jgi:hypothetical protein
MSNDRFILFYSNFCAHSKEFIQLLYKSEYNTKFIKVSVDDGKVRLPQCITSVPSIIVPGFNRPLVGDEVFGWLQSASNKNRNGGGGGDGGGGSNNSNSNSNANDGIEAYSSEMNGYSDNFSYLGDAKPLDRSFAFLNSQSNTINTPTEASFENPKASQDEKSEMTMAYEQLISQRTNDTPKGIARQ